MKTYLIKIISIVLLVTFTLSVIGQEFALASSPSPVSSETLRVKKTKDGPIEYELKSRFAENDTTPQGQKVNLKNIAERCGITQQEVDDFFEVMRRMFELEKSLKRIPLIEALPINYAVQECINARYGGENNWLFGVRYIWGRPGAALHAVPLSATVHLGTEEKDMETIKQAIEAVEDIQYEEPALRFREHSEGENFSMERGGKKLSYHAFSKSARVPGPDGTPIEHKGFTLACLTKDETLDIEAELKERSPVGMLIAHRALKGLKPQGELPKILKGLVPPEPLAALDWAEQRITQDLIAVNRGKLTTYRMLSSSFKVFLAGILITVGIWTKSEGFSRLAIWAFKVMGGGGVILGGLGMLAGFISLILHRFSGYDLVFRKINPETKIHLPMAILFDLDGTLVDTLRQIDATFGKAHYWITHATSEDPQDEEGLEPGIKFHQKTGGGILKEQIGTIIARARRKGVSEDELRDVAGRLASRYEVTDDVAALLAGEDGLVNAFIRLFEGELLDRIEQDPPEELPGATQIVRHLDSLGIWLYIGTGNTQRVAELILEKLGIRECFRAVYGTGGDHGILHGKAGMLRHIEKTSKETGYHHMFDPDIQFWGDQVADTRATRKAIPGEERGKFIGVAIVSKANQHLEGKLADRANGTDVLIRGLENIGPYLNELGIPQPNQEVIDSLKSEGFLSSRFAEDNDKKAKKKNSEVDETGDAFQAFFKDLERTKQDFSLLSRYEERALVKEIADGDGKAKRAKDKLAMHNLRLTVTAANKRIGALPYLDLLGEASVGLVRAADKYRLGKGAKFSTYALLLMKQDISKAITRKSRVVQLSYYIVRRIAKLKQALRNLRSKKERFTRADILAELKTMDEDWTEEELSLVERGQRFQDAQHIGVHQTRKKSAQLADETADPLANITDVSFWPEKQAERNDEQRRVQAAIDQLNKKQAMVLRQHYGEGKSLSEIARNLDPPETRANISNIKRRAEAELKEILGNKGNTNPVKEADVELTPDKRLDIMLYGKIAAERDKAIAALLDTDSDVQAKVVEAMCNQWHRGKKDTKRRVGVALSKIASISEGVNGDDIKRFVNKSKKGVLVKVEGIGPKTASALVRRKPFKSLAKIFIALGKHGNRLEKFIGIAQLTAEHQAKQVVEKARAEQAHASSSSHFAEVAAVRDSSEFKLSPALGLATRGNRRCVYPLLRVLMDDERKPKEHQKAAVALKVFSDRKQDREFAHGCLQAAVKKACRKVSLNNYQKLGGYIRRTAPVRYKRFHDIAVPFFAHNLMIGYISSLKQECEMGNPQALSEKETLIETANSFIEAAGMAIDSPRASVLRKSLDKLEPSARALSRLPGETRSHAAIVSLLYDHRRRGEISRGAYHDMMDYIASAQPELFGRILNLLQHQIDGYAVQMMVSALTGDTISQSEKKKLKEGLRKAIGRLSNGNSQYKFSQPELAGRAFRKRLDFPLSSNQEIMQKLGYPAKKAKSKGNHIFSSDHSSAVIKDVTALKRVDRLLQTEADDISSARKIKVEIDTAAVRQLPLVLGSFLYSERNGSLTITKATDKDKAQHEGKVARLQSLAFSGDDSIGTNPDLSSALRNLLLNVSRKQVEVDGAVVNALINADIEMDAFLASGQNSTQELGIETYQWHMYRVQIEKRLGKRIELLGLKRTKRHIDIYAIFWDGNNLTTERIERINRNRLKKLIARRDLKKHVSILELLKHLATKYPLPVTSKGAFSFGMKSTGYFQYNLYSPLVGQEKDFSEVSASIYQYGQPPYIEIRIPGHEPEKIILTDNLVPACLEVGHDKRHCYSVYNLLRRQTELARAGDNRFEESPAITSMQSPYSIIGHAPVYPDVRSIKEGLCYVAGVEFTPETLDDAVSVALQRPEVASGKLRRPKAKGGDDTLYRACKRFGIALPSAFALRPKKEKAPPPRPLEDHEVHYVGLVNGIKGLDEIEAQKLWRSMKYSSGKDARDRARLELTERLTTLVADLALNAAGGSLSPRNRDLFNILVGAGNAEVVLCIDQWQPHENLSLLGFLTEMIKMAFKTTKDLEYHRKALPEEPKRSFRLPSVNTPRTSKKGKSYEEYQDSRGDIDADTEAAVLASDRSANEIKAAMDEIVAESGLPTFEEAEKEYFKDELRAFLLLKNIDDIIFGLGIPNVAIYIQGSMGYLGVAVKNYSNLNLFILTDGNPDQNRELLFELRRIFGGDMEQANTQTPTLTIGTDGTYQEAIDNGNGLIKLLIGSSLGSQSEGFATIEAVSLNGYNQGTPPVLTLADQRQRARVLYHLTEKFYEQGPNGILVFEQPQGASKLLDTKLNQEIKQRMEAARQARLEAMQTPRIIVPGQENDDLPQLSYQDFRVYLHQSFIERQLSKLQEAKEALSSSSHFAEGDSSGQPAASTPKSFTLELGGYQQNPDKILDDVKAAAEKMKAQAKLWDDSNENINIPENLQVGLIHLFFWEAGRNAAAARTNRNVSELIYEKTGSYQIGNLKACGIPAEKVRAAVIDGFENTTITMVMEFRDGNLHLSVGNNSFPNDELKAKIQQALDRARTLEDENEPDVLFQDGFELSLFGGNIDWGSDLWHALRLNEIEISGFGTGIPLLWGIAKEHNASLEHTSDEEAEQTTFALHLPLSPAHFAEREIKTRDEAIDYIFVPGGKDDIFHQTQNKMMELGQRFIIVQTRCGPHEVCIPEHIKEGTKEYYLTAGIKALMEARDNIIYHSFRRAYDSIQQSKELIDHVIFSELAGEPATVDIARKAFAGVMQIEKYLQSPPIEELLIALRGYLTKVNRHLIEEGLPAADQWHAYGRDMYGFEYVARCLPDSDAKATLMDTARFFTSLHHEMSNGLVTSDIIQSKLDEANAAMASFGQSPSRFAENEGRLYTSLDIAGELGILDDNQAYEKVKSFAQSHGLAQTVSPDGTLALYTEEALEKIKQWWASLSDKTQQGPDTGLEAFQRSLKPSPARFGEDLETSGGVSIHQTDKATPPAEFHQGNAEAIPGKPKEQLSFEDVAKELGISKEAVRQAERSALIKLRRRLADFWDPELIRETNEVNTLPPDELISLLYGVDAEARDYVIADLLVASPEIKQAFIDTMYSAIESAYKREKIKMLEKYDNVLHAMWRAHSNIANGQVLQFVNDADSKNLHFCLSSVAGVGKPTADMVVQGRNNKISSGELFNGGRDVLLILENRNRFDTFLAIGKAAVIYKTTSPQPSSARFGELVWHVVGEIAEHDTRGISDEILESLREQMKTAMLIPGSRTDQPIEIEGEKFNFAWCLASSQSVLNVCNAQNTLVLSAGIKLEQNYTYSSAHFAEGNVKAAVEKLQNEDWLVRLKSAYELASLDSESAQTALAEYESKLSREDDEHTLYTMIIRPAKNGLLAGCRKTGLSKLANDLISQEFPVECNADKIRGKEIVAVVEETSREFIRDYPQEFVALAILGSLAKGYFDKTSDIDIKLFAQGQNSSQMNAMLFALQKKIGAESELRVCFVSGPNLSSPENHGHMPWLFNGFIFGDEFRISEARESLITYIRSHPHSEELWQKMRYYQTERFTYGIQQRIDRLGLSLAESVTVTLERIFRYSLPFTLDELKQSLEEAKLARFAEREIASLATLTRNDAGIPARFGEDNPWKSKLNQGQIEIVDAIQTVLKNHFTPFVVYIYGSFGNGTYNSASDIDIGAYIEKQELSETLHWSLVRGLKKLNRDVEFCNDPHFADEDAIRAAFTEKRFFEGQSKIIKVARDSVDIIKLPVNNNSSGAPARFAEFDAQAIDGFYSTLFSPLPKTEQRIGLFEVMVDDRIRYENTECQAILEDKIAYLKKKGYTFVPFNPSRASKRTIAIVAVDNMDVGTIDEKLLQNASIVLPVSRSLPLVGEYCVLGELLYRYKHGASDIPLDNLISQFHALGIKVTAYDIRDLLDLTSKPAESARKILQRFIFQPVVNELEMIRELLQHSYKKLTEVFA